MKRTSKAQKVKTGVLLGSLAAAAGALTAVMILQKRKEEVVYHEAELKAMDELEAFMREEACDCDGVEESAASSVRQQEEAPAEPDYDDSARKEYAQAHLDEAQQAEEDDEQIDKELIDEE